MAILNRITKGRLSTQSIRGYIFYAIGEVVLIFAGITLSIWFSNWNEARKEREVEVAILIELKAALVSGLDDIKFNIDARKTAIRACESILALMEDPLEYHDSLANYFSSSLGLVGTQVKNSAYENLKTRGLHILTNDSLRIKIVNLYDVTYPFLRESESRHDDLFFNYLVEFNSTRFDSTNPFEPMRPLDYRRLMEDQKYKYYLKLLIFYNTFIMNGSIDGANEITDLINSIETEIRNIS